ncbi:MAG: GNAT family N-acetyltransferase [Pseudomonadota bacterium]
MSLTDNTAEHRFEWSEQGDVAIAEYRLEPNNTRLITHVETPAQLQGGGVAKRLMDGVVAFARAENIKLKARCPYAVAYRKRYPKSADVLD